MSFPAFGQEFLGSARVVDGDTLDLGLQQNIRLHGIDAPERGQDCTANGRILRCGAAATSHLKALINKQPVRCVQTDWDARYKRRVARCFVRDQDLGERMVKDGFAYAFVTYSTDYVDAEKAARLTGTGLWSGRFDDPALARKAKRLIAEHPTGGCKLKGNISRAGTKIFHAPEQADYAATRINSAKGERYFCTAAQARAAGWRAAKR